MRLVSEEPSWPSGIPKIERKSKSIDKRPNPVLTQTLGQAAILLAIVGLTLYGLTSLAYDSFYGPLGVDPGDVGLTYSSVMARVTGLSVLFVTCLILAILYPLTLMVWRLARYRVRRRRRYAQSGSGESHSKAAKLMPPLGAAALIIFSILLITIGGMRDGHSAALAVKRGKPVGPTGRFFTLLAFRADPVSVEAIGNPKIAQSITRFGCSPSSYTSLCWDKLFYLGQANGIVVLYNSTDQRSIHLPASSIMLHVSNCRTKLSPDLLCRSRFKFGGG
jgi:hypothetical protein